MDDQATFLYAAIEDTQGTIRSIDIRCGFLFVLLLSPVAVGDKLLSWAVSCDHHMAARILTGATCLAWIVAMAMLFSAVAALSNPAKHVRHAHGVSGSFYSGDLYRVNLLGHVWDRGIHSFRSLDDEVAQLPSSIQDVVRELTFERMKLAFVRAVKMRRYNSALALTPVVILLGITSYAVSLV